MAQFIVEIGGVRGPRSHRIGGATGIDDVDYRAGPRSWRGGRQHPAVWEVVRGDIVLRVVLVGADAPGAFADFTAAVVPE
jgi:hypothetical protein